MRVELFCNYPLYSLHEYINYISYIWSAISKVQLVQMVIFMVYREEMALSDGVFPVAINYIGDCNLLAKPRFPSTSNNAAVVIIISATLIGL